jgi:hypothetical protein
MNLSSQGYSPDLCLDFDFAVVAFHQWVEAKTNEQKQVSAPPPLRPRHVMGSRYTDMGQILALYGPNAGGNGLDPIVAGLTDEDLADFIDGWDA